MGNKKPTGQLVGSTDAAPQDAAAQDSATQAEAGNAVNPPSDDQPKPNASESAAGGGAGTADASTTGADGAALPVKVGGLVEHIGTKALLAAPMTRGDYNTYRGWTIPADEDPSEAGYLVEYLDGGKPNDDRHTGYISWSPADVFARAYFPVDGGDEIDAMPIGDLRDKYRSLSGQIDALAATIMELDLRGTEDGGACEIAEIRLREFAGAKAGEASDEKRKNADEFADRAGKQQRKARKADATADYSRAVAGLTRFAEIDDGAELQLRFADGEAFLSDAPAIAVERHHLDVGSDGRAIYREPVDFGAEGARTDVTEAWLIAGKQTVRCAMVIGLPVGGGRAAKIPAGNLIF